jgi:hypothetical protein
VSFARKLESLLKYMFVACMACHNGGLGSIQAQSLWDLWWLMCHWDKFFSCQFYSTDSENSCFIHWSSKLHVLNSWQCH